MTREEIIRMAREVGAGEPNDLYGRSDYVVMTQYELERFSALITAAEREACAGICEEQRNAVVKNHPARIEFDPNNFMAKKCAAAIRARDEDKS